MRATVHGKTVPSQRRRLAHASSRTGICPVVRGHGERPRRPPAGGEADHPLTAPVVGAGTSVLVALGPEQTAVTGRYAAAVRATKAGSPGPWTLDELEILIVDHPAE